jgi:hypothetical protein
MGKLHALDVGLGRGAAGRAAVNAPKLSAADETLLHETGDIHRASARMKVTLFLPCCMSTSTRPKMATIRKTLSSKSSPP